MEVWEARVGEGKDEFVGVALAEGRNDRKDAEEELFEVGDGCWVWR